MPLLHTTLDVCCGSSCRIFFIAVLFPLSFPRASTECMIAPNFTGHVVIPDTLQAIRVAAFQSCGALESVTMSNSVVAVGESAFKNCSRLTTVVLSNSISRIEAFTFSQCTSLTSITIPMSATAIGIFAFENCIALSSFIIPNSVTVIEDNAFQDCTAMATIDFGDSVCSIQSSAFYSCTSLQTVFLTDSVTSVGQSAFYDCQSLHTIFIPDSIQFIGSSALPSCVGFGLSSGIHYVDDLSDEEDDGVDFYSPQRLIPKGFVSCFPCNSSTLALPDSVVALAMPSFAGCKLMENVSISDSITYIGDIVFYNAVSLQHVSLASSVTYIGPSAFAMCSSLQNVVLPDSLMSISYSSFSSCTSLEKIVIPDSATYVGYAAFGDCTGLVTVELGSSVATIGTKAFTGCTQLSSITFPDSVGVLQPFCFQYCSSLSEVYIPNSITSIGSGAFYGCNICSAGTVIFGDDDDITGPSVYGYSVEKLHLSISTVSYIMPYTIYHCDQLVSVSISDSVMIIRENGISFSPFLDNVVIPDSVQNIEFAAFQGCSGLKSIQIPPTVNVSSGAFFGCGCNQQLYKSGAMLNDCIAGYLNSTRQWMAFTACSGQQYERVPGSFTANRACSWLTQCDTSTEFEAVNPTATSDRVCKLKLSTWKRVCIGVGVTLAVVTVALGAMYLYKKRKRTERDLHLKELLLNDERTAKQSLYAENIEMKRAWEIAEDDLRMGAVVASGAFGNVFRASWGHIEVAVKMLKQSISDEALDGEDFTREVSFMQRIRHPNLLVFYGAGITATNSPFLVVEWMSNGSLRSVLQSSKKLDSSLRLRIALDIAYGMRHLHSLGSIHRDLKSDNCLVGANMRVKVGDFGESKLLKRGVTDEDASNHRSSVSALHTTHVGTPLWMAPELMIAGGRYGQEIDVYSYAIVMWELLTRATPWEADLIEQSEAAFVLALYDAVGAGRRPAIPSHSDLPQSYTVLLTRCWAHASEERPRFTEISTRLEEMFHFAQDRTNDTSSNCVSRAHIRHSHYDFAQ
eukprot:m.1086978 g.1086978  ORF g.1086978 m.1086978 type:complete len:1024 (-) comp24282_c0_seq1:196-3267(-)